LSELGADGLVTGARIIGRIAVVGGEHLATLQAFEAKATGIAMLRGSAAGAIATRHTKVIAEARRKWIRRRRGDCFHDFPSRRTCIEIGAGYTLADP
jgi:hypothetical protein